MPHLLNLPYWLKNTNKEIKELYATQMIRAFASSLISVFIPIYLLDLGYTFKSVMLFLLALYGTYAASAVLALYSGHKIGTKHTILLGSLATVSFWILLFSLETLQVPLSLIIIAGAIGAMFYWIPVLSHFAKNVSKTNIGKQVTLFSTLPKFVAIAGPTFGGLGIAYWGFNSVFLIASFILLLAVIPLFLSKEYKAHIIYGWKTLIRRDFKFMKEFYFQAIFTIITAVIFPIYIYTITNSAIKTGLMASLMGLGMLLVSLYYGRILDKYPKAKLLRSVGVANFLIWVCIILIKNPNILYTLAFLLGLANALFGQTLFAIFCNKLKKRRASHMVVREFALAGGRLTAFLIMAVVASSAIKFEIAFIFAALSSLYFLIARY